MKLATFTHRGAARIGVVADDEIVDLSAAAAELPREMIDFIAAGPPALEAARKAVSRPGNRVRLAEVKLEAPIRCPPEFIGVGRNYAEHLAETGSQKPQFIRFFNKQTSCVNGPYDPIYLPRLSPTLDYEGELAFVIGRRCRHVPRARAREVIAGYLVANDVSVREWQRLSPTVTLGKSWDTHGPIGPWIVTADEIPDPHALELSTRVNGELRQHANTGDMIFNCFEQVETLSTVCTLRPGTIFSTGTPSGVALGMTPPRWLRAGDVVRVEIERIGHIENRVIEEPADTARI